VLGSLSVLPAILFKLGRWVDRPRVPFLGRRIQRAEPGRFWAAALRPALRAPWATFVLSAGVLVVVAIPALDLNLKRPTSTDLPRSIPILRAFDRLAQAFPGNDLGASHTVAIRTDPGGRPAVEREIAELTRSVKADRRFAQDRKPTVRRSADGTVFVVAIHVAGASDSTEATQSLQRLRRELLPRTVGTVEGAEWAVAGRTASDADSRQRMAAALPLVIAFVFAMTFLVMLVTFRSVVVALTSIVLNALSVAASYGVLVLVFQRTWAEGLLGFTSNGGVVSWLPLMLFVILFGLSMDYHVFVVSRIREAARGGATTREAVERGIVSSASTVSSAAIIMVAVFAIFATLSVVEFKQLGVALAAAILIDATIIRAVVLPSAMVLLGEANWWAPRFLAGPRRSADADTQIIAVSAR
jgi:RND superfamily putative drug exporter